MLKKMSFAVIVLAASTTVSLAARRPEPKPPKAPPTKSWEAPEIDSSSAIAGFTLLAGGIAVMLGRRSKRVEMTA